MKSVSRPGFHVRRQFRAQGSAMCNGQLISVSQNAALYSLSALTMAATASDLRLAQSAIAFAGAYRPGIGLSTYVIGQTEGRRP